MARYIYLVSSGLSPRQEVAMVFVVFMTAAMMVAAFECWKHQPVLVEA
jgi:hypothetical protein